MVAVCVLGATLTASLIVENWPTGHVIPIVQAQDDHPAGARVIEIEPPMTSGAVETVSITVGKEQISPGIYRNPQQPGKRFQADENWLKNLRFVLKNQTSKTIVYVALAACFPETMETGDMMCWPVQMGRIPSNEAYTPSGERLNQGNAEPLQFAPGKQVTVSLPRDDAPIREFLEQRQSFSGVTECFINLNGGFFDDGMQWNKSGYALQDPDHPGNFKLLDGSYFPGERPKS